MAKLLTRRKRKWVKSFKPDVLRGDTLNLPTAVEMRYFQELDRLVNKMADGVEQSIRQMFEKGVATEYFAQDESISSQARILTNALRKKYDRLFADSATPLAKKMVKGASKASSSALHSSLEQLSGGLSLPTRALGEELTQILNASITENVGLIKSISEQYLTGVQGAVMRSITSGNGMQDLMPYLLKHRGVTRRRARIIALDQTRKAYNNLNRGRMENLGLKKFEWLHTGGSNHPRKLHQRYNGRIFSFDDLPVIDEDTGERGIPGQAINCRCRMRPVLDFEGNPE